MKKDIDTIVEDYEKQIIDLKRNIAYLQNENNSLINTLNEYTQYKQLYLNSQNEIYSLKIEKQNLIGLRDALNRRIVLLENENEEFKNRINNI